MKIAMIDVTTMCTAKCKYCLHQYRNMTVPQFMSMENFLKISKILKFEKFDYIYLYFSGESLLHKDYWEMVSVITDLGMVCNTASKLCFNIDFDKVKKTIKKAKTKIHFDITIDADIQEIQDKISKNIITEQVYDNLKELSSIILKSEKASILVCTVINKYNEDRLQEIKNKVLSCGILKWKAKSMGYYMGYRANVDDYNMITEMKPSKSTRFDVINGKIKSNMTSCKGFIKPIIGVNGEVTICCHDMLYNESKWNIFDYCSLDKIIDSEVYKTVVKKGKLMSLEICKGCN